MSTAVQGAASRWEAQRSFDELGRPLRDITFTVVDLETTGGSAAGGSMITEIGAVKVRSGEVLGEFQTLVNPRAEIPPFIAVLTGITNAMVSDAPSIESALPAFLEFAAGTVLVAHNAPFDVGFLQHFNREQGRAWPRFEVLDTAKLARRVITRDDAPNCKLSSLARVFNSTTTPNHRALSDARATVDVLHGLMERLGGLGVHTLEELQTFSSRVSASQRKKRHLAESLPHSPGVYLFKDDRSRVLYIGTSRDLRSRVRTYFTASETRSRMGEMVNLASTVTGIECATPLEAEVRELRYRRAQAEIQPPLAVSREGPLRQAHPRGLAQAVAGAPGARRRRRLPRPLLLPQDRREVPGRAARDVPGAPVLRQAATHPDPRHPVGLRAGRDGSLPVSV
ncbi:DEDD exonuclease domain-containing protein [Nocardioides sp. InS609-2]|uniref:DEDD exonuclease domain-containing protein n=1 Tax=Nocardioides sp. InS609-2 TaxID=2760705 RepID=UPI0032BF2D7E